MVTARRRAALLLACAAALAAPGTAHAPSARADADAGPAPVATAAAVPHAARPLLRPGGVAAARRWAARREGTVAFAVADGRGRIRGLRLSRTFESASVSKAMLLVAALRAARRRPLRADERALLHPMVTRSDNAAASAVYARLGGAAVSRVARLARMTHFEEAGHWSGERISAADQARLFWRLHRLLPARHRAYGRRLLAGVVPAQRWGMPPVARDRGMRILLKGGWRTGLTHQVARVERGGRHVAVAVLTAGSPSMAYAEATIGGIARRVLAP